MKNRLLLTIGFIIASVLSGCVSYSTKEKTSTMSELSKKPIVIAHRGASGYAPEHSLVAKAIAHTMGVDYIEQDVVMTKDDHLVVLHDPYLDRVTNVMEVFPDRSREVMGQNRWLAIDFTLAEIKSLNMTEGFDFNSADNSMTSPYPSRFPLFKSSFQVSTLEEEIELIQGLNQSTGKDIGLYVEVKTPWLHQMEGKDVSLKTLQVLKRYGYSSKDDKVFFQCFDPDELKRVHNELFAQLKMDIKLVQLIAHTDWKETMRLQDGELTAYDYDWMFSNKGMTDVATYADGIGPWMPMLVAKNSTSDQIVESELLLAARDNNLQIHPYTFRKEKDKIPTFAKDFNHLLDIFLNQLKVDGVFSDHPDKVIEFISKTE